MAVTEKHTILIISALDLWSIGEKQGGPALWQTLMGYANHDWNVYFITGNKDINSLYDIHPNISITRFDSHFLKRMMRIRHIGLFTRTLWWLFFQGMALLKAINLGKTNRFNLVYGYEIHGVPVAKLLSRLWHIPVISRFQGTTIGVFWMHKRLWKIRVWEHIFAMKIPTDLVIMTNDGTQGDKVLRKLGARMDRVKFWLNGIDMGLFSILTTKEEAKQQLKINEEFVLLTVSRLDTWKRVDRSVQAMPAILKKNPNTILLTVGAGHEKPRLVQLANDIGVSEKIIFAGAIVREKIPLYLAAADIFMSLFDWSNVGNPLLEAMVAGKCIVTLNNGDTGRFIQNGENGILLELNELHKLPDIICALLKDEIMRNKLSAKAKQYAKDNFWTWEARMAAEVQAVNALIK